jgi:hypothetical protein
MAGLGLATGVMLAVDHMLERREAKQLAADSVRAAKLLTTLHLEEFPELTAPVAPSGPRRWRRLWTVDQDEQAALEESYALGLARWELLCNHDPDEVIATVDEALADNASQSACVDAETGENGNYVTVVVHYPGPEITQGIVQVGATTRPRSEQEMTDLYRRALASTVIASAKEAFACAPAAIEAYVVVLRYDMRGRFKNKTYKLDAIYAGGLNRDVLRIDWTVRDPVEEMLRARAAQVNLDRKGRFRPLGDEMDDDLCDLVATIAETTESARRNRPKRRRYTRAESHKLMRSQKRQEFVAMCACPSCGEIDTHSLRTSGKGDPSWAAVIRNCAVCNREWVQQ